MKNRFEVEAREYSAKLLIVNLQDKDQKLVRNISNHFKDHLSIYLFSKKRMQIPGVHMLVRVSGYLLPNIKDTIDYCILLPSENQKETLKYIERLTSLSQKIIVVLKRDSDRLGTNFLKALQDNPHVSIALLGEVFGESNVDSQFSKNIAWSILNKEFQMPKDVLDPVFAISEHDMFLGFEYMMFSSRHKKNSYALYYKTPNTVTSLMHQLRRVEPELSVVYVKDSRKKNTSLSEEDLQSVLKTQDGHVQKLYVGFEKEVRAFTEKIKYHHIDREKRKQKFPELIGKIGSVAGFVLASFFLFIAASVIGLLMSVYFYKNATSAFLQGNFNKAENDMVIAQKAFQYTSPQMLFLTNQLDSISGSNTTKIIDSYSDVLILSSDVFLFVKSQLKNAEFTAEDPNALFGNAVFLYFLLQNNMQFESLPDSFKKYLPLFSILREAAGFKQEMKYLVLFQNDNELRPTGGFIGSVALLSVQNGKIKDLQVRDVYELDGQLKDHVEPNYVIRRYLQPHLYLRDSNFHPDFSYTASSAANIYNLETGNSIDGVIAVDTHVLEVLVEMMGEMSFPGSQKTVTKNEIVRVIQDSIHDDFFPGSTEKKDILSLVLSKIVIGLEEDNKKKIQFLKVLPDLFSEKHIQVAFNEEHLERGVVAAGVGGSLQDLRFKEGKVLDTVSVNEANIGVNKINEYIARKITYTAVLKNSGLNADILSEYTNNGSEDYTMYFRVLVPKDSLLEAVVIDGQEQVVVPAVTDPVFYEKKGFTPPQGLEVSDEKITEELKAFGFRVVVPKKSKKRIRILTIRSFFELPAVFEYSLKYIKQSGTMPYPLTLTLQLDDSFRFSNKTHNTNSVLYNGEVKKDIEVFSDVLKVN